MLTQQNNQLPEKFRVIAKDSKDLIYFVENINLSKFFWCYASQTLILGQTIEALVQPPQHPENYPLLIVY
jgi:hypothetical protein